MKNNKISGISRNNSRGKSFVLSSIGRGMGNKAYVFNLFMMITAAMVLTTAFIMFSQKYSPIDERKPAVQLQLFKGYAEGEKVQFYLDNAAKYASEDAVYSLAQSGGYKSPDCGNYGTYTLWNNQGDKCYPTVDELSKNYALFFSEELGKYTSKYKAEEFDIKMPTMYDTEFDNDAGDVIAKATEDLVIVPRTAKETAAAPITDLVWPTDVKTITSCYGDRPGGFHTGIDIDTLNQDPIYSVSAGTVVEVVNNCVGSAKCGGGYGNYVRIKHSNTFYTQYGHLTTVSVTEGQEVDAGEKIGTSGGTGGNYGDHLDFKINFDGNFDYYANDKIRNPLCLYQGMKDSIRLTQYTKNCGADSFTRFCNPDMEKALSGFSGSGLPNKLPAGTVMGKAILDEALKRNGNQYTYGGRESMTTRYPNGQMSKPLNPNVDRIGLLYVSMRSASIIGDDDATRFKFKEEYGIYYSYTPIPSENKELTEAELDSLLPGDLLFFGGSTGLFNPADPAVAKMVGKDKVIDIGHAGIYIGRKADNCHEYIDARSKSAGVVISCLEERMGWKSGKRHVYAARVDGEITKNLDNDAASQVVVIDISKAIKDPAKESDVRDFAGKLAKNIEASGINVNIQEQTYDDVKKAIAAASDQEEKDKIRESSFLVGSLYIEIDAAGTKPSLKYSSKFGDSARAKLAAEQILSGIKDDLSKEGIKLDKTEADARAFDERFSGGAANFPILILDISDVQKKDEFAGLFSVSIVNQFQKQGVKAAAKPEGNPLYTHAYITKYYTNYEGDFNGDWAKFAHDCTVQGSGLTLDGAICRYSSQCARSSCYTPPEKNSRGYTALGTNPTPHRTIAVDRYLYLDRKNPKTFFLDFMPYCDNNFDKTICQEWTGCYLAEDTGSKSMVVKPNGHRKGIREDHFDLYTGVGKDDLSKVAGKIPDAADIYEVECEPGTGGAGGLFAAETPGSAEEKQVDVTGTYEYTLKPATKQDVKYDLEQYEKYSPVLQAAYDDIDKCLAKDSAYENIKVCADEFSKKGSLIGISIDGGTPEDIEGGFFVGFSAETPFDYKYHSENPKAKFGIVVKDTYKPRIVSLTADAADEKTLTISWKGQSPDIEGYTLKYSVSGSNTWSVFGEFGSDYKSTGGSDSELKDALLNNKEVCFKIIFADENDNENSREIDCKSYGFDSSKISSVTVEYKGG